MSRAPAPPTVRFRVEPRDWPAAKVARLLGLPEARFLELLPDYIGRGFPRPDPTSGHFDSRAVMAWMDARSGLTTTTDNEDARARIGARLRAFNGGRG